MATRRAVSLVLWSLAVSITMLSSTPCILTSTSSSSASSSPGSMNSAMLSLEWKRLRAASSRSRIFTDTGMPSSGTAGPAGSDRLS